MPSSTQVMHYAVDISEAPAEGVLAEPGSEPKAQDQRDCAPQGRRTARLLKHLVPGGAGLAHPPIERPDLSCKACFGKLKPGPGLPSSRACGSGWKPDAGVPVYCPASSQLCVI